MTSIRDTDAPRTMAGRALLDWMEYIRDPEHYQPGNIGRGYFWDDDVPLVLRCEAEALAAARERIAALPRWANEDWRDDALGEPEHRDIETVDIAAVLRELGGEEPG